jgi:hypothetical protein
MKPAELERIRIVTRHFADLQGLREMVPSGIILLAFGSYSLAGGASLFARHAFLNIVCLTVVLAGVLLQLAAKRLYRRRFGEVERLTTEEGWESPEGWESALAQHGPRYFGGVEGPPSWRPPSWQTWRRYLTSRWRIETFLMLAGFDVNMQLVFRHSAQRVDVFCIASGAALFWRWMRLEMMGAQLYYPVLGALLLTAGALGGGGATLPSALGRLGAGMILVGATLVVAGLLDHRTLERVLRPAGVRRGMFVRARDDAEEAPWEAMQREETR